MAFHRRRLDADAAEFWRDRLALRESIYPDGRPEPNVAHEALAALERAGHVDAVLTQNVDGLHDDAGSEVVVELHGTNRAVARDDCGERRDAEPVFERARDGDLPTRCPCGGTYRPAVVLFGEELPDGRLERATAFARSAAFVLAVGSSLSVRPAARLPSIAASNGATLGVVNLDETTADERADAVVRDDVAAVLPQLRTRPIDE